ncbi:hypothetical protein Rsub_06826 [Raphidocelis subcapitata]|uniref:DUF155 domain-containing protein n=1 Tax=Raphidocelis subcapitata TaxID=307507 RepID=A0A2V0P9I6_9CHLO|nr:hypothetical protein Rsub_06826 [Raphidocelis subcapitata]|eukprot:GBF93827.1 hypothetical protein Rsub_06826 [Raphidocelis subcapitata]
MRRALAAWRLAERAAEPHLSLAQLLAVGNEGTGSSGGARGAARCDRAAPRPGVGGVGGSAACGCSACNPRGAQWQQHGGEEAPQQGQQPAQRRPRLRVVAGESAAGASWPPRLPRLACCAGGGLLSASPAPAGAPLAAARAPRRPPAWGPALPARRAQHTRAAPLPPAAAAAAAAAMAVPPPQQRWAPWHAAAAVPADDWSDDDGGGGGAAANAPAHAPAAAAAAHQQQQQQQQPLPAPAPDDIKLHVKAYHIGGAVDFQRFAADHAQLTLKHQLHRDHAVMELSDMPGGTVLLGRPSAQQAGAASAPRVLAVYNYGSAVFFNSDTDADAFWLEKLQAYVRDPHKQPLTDETTVVVRPGLDDWFALEPDHIVLQMLDLSNVRVIASIMGQSVALEHFDRLVIAAIERFTPVLSEIARKGVSKLVLPGLFSGIGKQLRGSGGEDELLKLIGESSLLHTDVVYKLGLLHPTDVAWRTDKYYDVWKALHADYDIEKRFEALKAKLGPMLANAKFVLEVREDKKSERSELIIICLIGVEIVLHVAGWYM